MRRDVSSAHGAPLLATDSTYSRAGQGRPGGTRSSERQIDPWLRIEALMLERTRGRRRRRGPLALLLDKIDEFVTERADARPREMGLDIRRIPGTRTHVYRDRRWDSRQECGACAGTGISGARSCGTCAGTGVVVTDPAAQVGDSR